MKNWALLFVLVLLLVSCDPVTYVAYTIGNSTDKNLVVYFYSSVDIENDTLHLSQNSIEKWRIVSVSGKSPEKIDFNQYYDSIIVKSSDLAVQRYFSYTTGKNIYDYGYWVENKKGKRDYEYTFEITDEDIAVEEGL